MLSESLGFYQVAWWFELFPGAFLLATTLAFNLLGDSVRDALDPRGERLFRRSTVIRFLIRRILLGLVVLWVITTVGLRDVLRRAAQRRPLDRGTPGDARDGRRRHAPPRPRPADPHAVHRLPAASRSTATSATRSTTRPPVASLLWQRVPVSFSLALGAAVIWLVLGLVSACSPRCARARGSTGPRPSPRCSSTRCRRSCSARCSCTSSSSGCTSPGSTSSRASGYVAAARRTRSSGRGICCCRG